MCTYIYIYIYMSVESLSLSCIQRDLSITIQILHVAVDVGP